MAVPASLYVIGNPGRQQWTMLTQPANTYGNSMQWINAALTGYGAPSANQAASIPRVGQMIGYAVTSHSSQGLTADRVLVNVDSSIHPDLINSRFAYVSVSRASLDARIYTNHAASLSKDLSHEVAKSAAMEVSQSVGHSAADWNRGFRL